MPRLHLVVIQDSGRKYSEYAGNQTAITSFFYVAVVALFASTLKPTKRNIVSTIG